LSANGSNPFHPSRPITPPPGGDSLFHGKPGSGPGPHRHPYDEIQFIREGRGVWTVGGQTFEGSAGDIFVIKAGEIHSFKAVGDSPLVQFDVHLSPRFIQENL
jgi:quercetin dioxygenase-like cupin family protein